VLAVAELGGDDVTGAGASPARPEIRASDADRDRVLMRLRDAMSEGRLTADEFDERAQVTLRARTESELAAVVADLPDGFGAGDVVELRGTFGSVKRKGAWDVPRTLRMHRRMGSVELDFTEATIAHPVVTLELDIIGGSVELRIPDGATISMEGLEVTLGSAEDHRKNFPSGVGKLHFQINGALRWGSLEIRGPRRKLFGG
jgi:hypothetical protein